MRVAHNVFFKLTDGSPAKVEELVGACRKCLNVQPGIVFFAAGPLCHDLTRPVNDLDSRAVVIGGLASVDRVTSFDDPTPLALIERLRPDVLIKGADYTREGVVGGDLVESWGGEVRLAAFADGYSTTRTIAKMTENGPPRASLEEAD